MAMQLILASRSPARAGLLRAAGYAFSSAPSDLEEPALAPGVRIDDHVTALARRKAEAVSPLHPRSFVIGCDTAVDFEGAAIGKASDAEDAVRILRLLSGRTHRLVTGLCVLASRGEERASAIRQGADAAWVTLRPWDETRIREYVRTVKPMGYAGAYALQADGAAIIERIEGDPSTIVGLPVTLLARFLSELGYAGAP